MNPAPLERLRHDALHRVLTNGPHEPAGRCKVLRTVHGIEETHTVNLFACVGDIGERIADGGKRLRAGCGEKGRSRRMKRAGLDVSVVDAMVG